jgi:hypothetical protein
MIEKSTGKMILMWIIKLLLVLKKKMILKPIVVCIHALSYTF